MSSSSSHVQASHVDGGFIRTRLGSLLAVVPLGVWVVNHLWNNLSAFKGEAAWQHDVTEYSHPLAFFASSIVALLPLGLLQVVYGPLFILLHIFSMRALVREHLGARHAVTASA